MHFVYHFTMHAYVYTHTHTPSWITGVNFEIITRAAWVASHKGGCSDFRIP